MASEASPETEPEIAQRIAALQERLERAAAATAALLDQAKREADPDPTGPADAGAPRASSGPRRPPPAGFQGPPDAGRASDGLAAELEAFARLIRGLEELIPPDLRRALADAVRELLLALRAVLDWCAERLAQRRATEPEIRDIPIL
jgi:hypothetical protein